MNIKLIKSNFYKNFLILNSWIFSAAIIAFFNESTLAQQSNIVPDRTLGNEKSVVNPNFNNAPIEVITGGAQRGQNLFHSFKEFNVSEGRGAYFYSPNANIANILTRVTGSNPSEIMGTLGTFGLSQPNLFLINPNGIIFGQNASLDVGGSFVATTANAIRLGERGFFSASQPQTSNLLSIQPSAFFFNALNRQAAIVHRSTATNPVLGGFLNGIPSLPEGATVRGLQVSDGKSMLLVGGDVQLEAGGKLSAYGGRIELGGLASAGEVGLVINGDTLSLKFPSNIPLADVSLLNDGRASVTGLGGGDIVVNANLFAATNGGRLVAGTEGAGNAGDIIVNANNVRISGKSDDAPSGFYNQNFSRNSGDTGDVSVFATDSIEFTDGLVETFSDPGEGDSGNITIQAKNAIAIEQSTIRSSAEGGDSGNITLQSDGAIALERSKILSFSFGGGDSGNITLQSAGNITLQSDGAIDEDEKSTIASGSIEEGKPGNVSIQAGKIVTLEDTWISSRPPDNQIPANSGNISVQADSSVILKNSTIESRIFNRGTAGNIEIFTDGAITLDGTEIETDSGFLIDVDSQSGNINITAGSLALINGSSLSSSLLGQGKAGNIHVNVSGSLIASGASRLDALAIGKGDAGNITIQAGGAVSFDGVKFTSLNGMDAWLASGVVTTAGSTLELGLGQGRSGNIKIEAQSLSLTNGATLSAGVSNGKGNAGNIFVNVNDGVTLSGLIEIPDDFELPDGFEFSYVPSFISNLVLENAVGNAGNINIKAKFLSLQDSSFISAANFGRGNAGNILVRTLDSVNFSNGSSLSAATAGQGNGGNVTIDAGGAVSFDGEGSGVNNPNSRLNGVLLGRGNAGNIKIEARSLSLTNRASLFSATQGRGDAGNIFIETSDFVSLDNSFILSSVEESGIGKGGDITIKARSLSLNNRATFFSSTEGRGNAGNIFVETSDSISLDNGFINATVESSGIGKGGDINIDTQLLSLKDGSQLRANTFGQGNAGNIRVDASERLEIAGVRADGFSSGLLTATEEGAIGRGGNINVNTTAFRIADGAVVNAQTSNAIDAGNIMINANTFEATSGGQLITSTRSGGRAGNINLNITDSLFLSGSDPTFSERLAQFGEGIVNNQSDASGLFANTTSNSSGDGGDIFVDSKTAIAQDGARIAVGSQGTGDGGDINLKADSLTLENEALLSTETTSTDGGNINLQINDILLLGNNSQISTTAGTAQASGNGGNIDIDAKFIIANPIENSDITANAFEGRGGNINLTAQGIFGLQDRNDNTNFSDITASSQIGVDGVVQIDTPDTDPSQGIVNLPSNVVDASQLIDQRCLGGGATASQQGEFVITGRGGIPANPREPLPGEAVLSADWLTLDTEAESNAEAETPLRSETSSPQPIIEAQGWIVDRDGKVILTAQVPTATPNSPVFAPHSCPVEVTN